MNGVIVFVMIAGTPGAPRDIEYVQTKQRFLEIEVCREKASELNVYAEMPTIDNGLLHQYYMCVAI
ncbi:MAG: hypothetical protein P8N62_00495 [Alphaproteobacteria bacterium]|nr:hypothetical protein [Alphaproteobacteria bacterium]